MSDAPTLSDTRYELGDLIGEGGMATVWRARDRETDRTVAIKVLHPREADELQTVQRFFQEFAILTELDHPCIVKVFGSGVTAETSQPYVVMEWIEGITLRDLLRRSPRPPPPDVADLIAQVCSALTEAHGHDVIHRDLKPENILLAAPEHLSVKVVDFGMAKVLRSNAPQLTAGMSVFGTPEYMSPERATGRPPGPPADVYATGIIAYEMLAGARPFGAGSPTKTLVAQVHEDPPPMPPIDEEVEAAVRAALEKDPDARPSPAEFAHRLARALTDGEPGERRRTTKPTTIGRA